MQTQDVSATRGPSPDLLLDVRIPTELTVSPDGRQMAFALAATCSEHGDSVPWDLWLTQDGVQRTQDWFDGFLRPER